MIYWRTDAKMTSPSTVFCFFVSYKTNRFNVPVGLYRKRSQKTSKCCKNISDTLDCASCPPPPSPLPPPHRVPNIERAPDPRNAWAIPITPSILICPIAPWQQLSTHQLSWQLNLWNVRHRLMVVLFRRNAAPWVLWRKSNLSSIGTSMGSNMYQAHWTYPLKYILLCCAVSNQRYHAKKSLQSIFLSPFAHGNGVMFLRLSL